MDIDERYRFACGYFSDAGVVVLHVFVVSRFDVALGR